MQAPEIAAMSPTLVSVPVGGVSFELIDSEKIRLSSTNDFEVG